VDGNWTARLADFGIAKILYLSPTSATTFTGGTHGTYRYMAPELFFPPDDSPIQLSFASDIYALAITLWQVSVLNVSQV
jgi:serine/threonine protein kinase